jgi:hypothetical protein
MLTSQAAAQKLQGAGLQYDSADVAQLASQNIFPGAQKDARGTWQIPEADIDQFILLRRQGQAQQLRRRKLKWIATIIVAAFGLIGGFLLFNSGLKDTLDLYTQYIHPFITSFIEKSPEPKIEKVITAKNDSEYKLQVTIFNPLDRELLVNTLKIEYRGYLDPCQAAGGETYAISNTITVLGKEQDGVRFSTEVRSNNPDLAGYNIIGNGEFGMSECGYQYDIEFPTSMVLQKQSYSSFYVVIPKRFRVTKFIYGSGADPSKVRPEDLPRFLSERENEHYFAEYIERLFYDIKVNVSFGENQSLQYTLAHQKN